MAKGKSAKNNGATNGLEQTLWLAADKLRKNIDPPYNTCNDSFDYPDRFKKEKEVYESRAVIKDAEVLPIKDHVWRSMDR